MRAAKEEGRRAVINEVQRFMRNQLRQSPTDYTNKLHPGTLFLKKRTSFPISSPRKLAYKVTVEGYKIVKKMASNSFEVEKLRTKERRILPGDQLVKVSALDETELKCLVGEMEEIVRRNTTNTATGINGRGHGAKEDGADNTATGGRCGQGALGGGADTTAARIENRGSSCGEDEDSAPSRSGDDGGVTDRRNNSPGDTDTQL